jgi:hypothetical protein
MLRLINPEEPPTEELNPDYTDDLGNDLPGATPHPFIDPIHIANTRIASALLFCNNDDVRNCTVVTAF